MKRTALLLFVVVAAGCGKPTPAPASAAPATVPAGVSVDTGQAMIPLSAFSLGIAHALPVRNTPHVVPQVAAVKAFVVNEPNTSKDALKLYWVRDLDLIFSADQAPIAAQITQRDGSAYEIVPPDVPEPGGYLMLVIASPAGGPSRYYAVGRKS